MNSKTVHYFHNIIKYINSNNILRTITNFKKNIVDKAFIWFEVHQTERKSIQCHTGNCGLTPHTYYDFK